MRCQSRSSCVLLAAFLVAAGSAGGVSAEDAAFGQFSTHTTDVNTLQTSPDGHELHFIQDANARIWEWHKDKEQYVPHDEDAHHHPDHGHHHKVMFNFESGNPPKELQKDEHGHPLIELFNQKDKTRYVWMYDDGNYHDADFSLVPEFHKKLEDYKAPVLAYWPYHGPYISQLLIKAVKELQYEQVLHYMLKTRVDVNYQDELGNTALHYAHQSGFVQMMSLLGTHHADFDIRNKKGQTPYDMFEEHTKSIADQPTGPLMENVADQVITINFRFSKHSEHEHWEPGAAFLETHDHPDNWHPSVGKYHHHFEGQPVGRGEPDKIDL